MAEKRKFGPTRGEYVFRACAGAGILLLIAYAVVIRGIPGGLVASESILFGSAFALFLVVHSSWKLVKKDYREV